jgi:hypothetical protein
LSILKYVEVKSPKAYSQWLKKTLNRKFIQTRMNV